MFLFFLIKIESISAQRMNRYGDMASPGRQPPSSGNHSNKYPFKITQDYMFV